MNRLMAPSGTGVDCDVELPEVLPVPAPPDPPALPVPFEPAFAPDEDDDEPEPDPPDARDASTVAGVVAARLWFEDATRLSTVPLEPSDVRPDVLCAAGVVAEFVEAPVPRRLARVRGRIDDLLSGSRYEEYEDRWLQITLTDERRPSAAMERLRRRFPHALVLGFEPEGGGTGDARTWTERVRERSELDIAGDFVAEVTDGPATEAERALLDEAFEHCRRKEALA